LATCSEDGSIRLWGSPRDHQTIGSEGHNAEGEEPVEAPGPELESIVEKFLGVRYMYWINQMCKIKVLQLQHEL